MINFYIVQGILRDIVERKVYRRERHLRWNLEESPNNPELVRYHFVVVDDKNREGIMNILLEQIQRVSSGIERIRKLGGDVGGSSLKYLFASYDTPVAPSEIDFTKLGKPIKRDINLKERVRRRSSVEDYVANLYER